MIKLSETIDRKFTEIFDASDWLIETDTGWEDLIDVKETVPYNRWELIVDDHSTLYCADDHIVFDSTFNEIFVKDLQPGDYVQTRSGKRKVLSVTNTRITENMYDVGVNSDNHRYYSNGILSHNTTCAAGYLLWHAMFHPDQTILIAAHKFTGAQEIMQRIRYAYELCPDHIRAGVTNYNKGSIEFENGSRIVSATTTGTTGRGMSISLLYADELAYVPETIADEFWTSISPTLSTGGRAIITSTPNSDEDLFATIWKEANKKFDEYGNETELGINGFFPFTCKYSEHPDRNEAWAEKERGRIGEEKWRREFLCEFLIDDETLISSAALAELTGIPPLMTMGQTRWYKKPKAGNIYLAALDPCLGTGGNSAGIQVFELPSFDQVAEWHNSTTPIQGQIRILKEMLKYIQQRIGDENSSDIYWSLENNTVGEAGLVVISEIGEENFPGMLLSEPMKKGHVRKFRKGFNTTHKSKITAASKLKHFIESKKMKIRSRPLISELKTYVAQGVSFRAKNGEEDDLVSALLLIIRMSQVLADWDPRVFDSIISAGGDTDEEYQLPMPIFISTGGI